MEANHRRQALQPGATTEDDGCFVWLAITRSLFELATGIICPKGSAAVQ